MAYYLVTFTPVTWRAFLKGDRTVTGFKEQRNIEEVRPGSDVFVCYLTRLSRWFGILDVESGPYRDGSPIFADGRPLFTPSPDSSASAHEKYTARFKVKPDVVLDEPEYAVPIYEPGVWDKLSFTRGQQREDAGWKGFLRGNLKSLAAGDGSLLAGLLREQHANPNPKSYQLRDKDRRELAHAGSCGS